MGTHWIKPNSTFRARVGAIGIAPFHGSPVAEYALTVHQEDLL